MSFGFSARDFLVAGQIIKDIVICLKSKGGAKSEYQELIRELSTLDIVLQYLDRLDDTALHASKVNSIKYAALSCRHPLSEFLAKITKYEKSLGVCGTSGITKSTFHKLKFTFWNPEEIKKLQAYLNVHIGTINILLAEHGLDVMADITTRIDQHYFSLCRELQLTRTKLATIEQSVPAQAFLLQKVYSTMIALHEIITGELRTNWYRLSSMISNVSASTQQIHAIVVEIRNSLVVPDTRMTYFQAPLIIEDALGFKFPVPSEYDFDMLNTIIRRRFKSGHGHHSVQLGNYELCKANSGSTPITENTRLFPGMSIRMAIIMSVKRTIVDCCPMPNCNTVYAQSYPDGGFICAKCQVRFDKSSEACVYKEKSPDWVLTPDELITPAIPANLQARVQEDVQALREDFPNVPINVTMHDIHEDCDSLRNVVWSVAGNTRGEVVYESLLDQGSSIHYSMALDPPQWGMADSNLISVC